MGGTATYTVILIVTTLFSKLLGFARELSMAYTYGAGVISDAHKVAFNIPTIIFSGICSALLTGYITLYTELKQKDPRRMQSFSDSVVTLVFLLSAVILAVFWLFKHQIVRLFAISFTPETHALTVEFAQVMMLSVLFIGVYFIFQGFLQLNHRFLAVGLVSVPLNLAMVVSILLSSPQHYMVMAWGVVAGYAAAFVMLLAAARRSGFTYRPRLDLRDPYIGRLIRMVVPIFLGKTVVQLSTMADQTIASALPPGSISVLSYGNRITGMVTSVFVISLTTALFPELTRLSARHSVDKLKRTFRQSVGLMSLLIIPISAGLMIFSREIAALVYGHGAATPEDTIRIGEVIFYYSMGLTFFSIKEVMINVFYALQDTKTPTLNTLAALVLNIILNLALVGPMAHRGLALATSISGFVTMFPMMVSLRKKIGPLGLRSLLISILKMGTATAGMALAVTPAYDFLLLKTGSMALSLGAAILAGALVYGVLNILLRTREMGIFVVGLVERLTPKKNKG